ncbi:MAG TPA: site-2 protease family protein [Solirubrobacteraceae bacterium]|nr:site-2 protease family protein [Solirubrobacteraceae bacterium]
MTGKSIRIGRIAGIPIGMSPWWLVIVALFTWSLGAYYFPEVISGIAPATSYALGFVSVLLLFASIVLHELGHAIVARRHGIQIEEIDLWLLGGVSKMSGDAHEPGDELRYALAGPAVTAIIAVLFGAIALLLPASTPAVVKALVGYQALANCLILVFNMLPAFPLDGGRVLRSLLWRRGGDMRRATDTAAGVGRVFGYLLVGLGVLELLNGSPGGLWLGAIGFFIVIAAGAQAVGAEVQAVFSGLPARELMSSPVVSVPASISLEAAARDYFLAYRYNAFPATGLDGTLLGLLEMSRLSHLTPAQRAASTVGEVADRDPALRIAADQDVALLLERPAFARVGRAVVVDERQVPVGLLSITDVQRALRAARLAGAGQRRPTALAG